MQSVIFPKSLKQRKGKNIADLCGEKLLNNFDIILVQ
jgi:hypothetical protein